MSISSNVSKITSQISSIRTKTKSEAKASEIYYSLTATRENVDNCAFCGSLSHMAVNCPKKG
jgi:hypothetical protein